MSSHTASSQGIADITGILGGLSSLFGGTQAQTGTVTSTTASTGRQTEQLLLDQAAIQKIIEDVLGGPSGLASIFGGEQVAGIFDSSVAAQAAGDITSKLVGELAKLTAIKETTQEAQQTLDQTSKTEKKDEGLLSSIGGFFGF